MILLTGATGFLGSHLLKKLIYDGYEVLCLKRTSSNCEKVKNVFGQCKWYDIDKQPLEGVFEENRIECIVHCATDYGRSGENVLQTWKSNVIFPFELFEQAVLCGCAYFINTDSFFAKKVKELWNTDERLYMDAYTKSKFVFRNIVKDSIRDKNIAFVNMCLEHIYGSGDNADKFVNYIVRKLKENVDTIELSAGTQYRDWLYVDDAVEAYMTIIKKRNQLKMGQYYQYEIGTGTATTLREFVETVKKITKSTTDIQYGKRPMNPCELQYSCANVQKILEYGWRAKIDIEKGISMLLEEEF